MVRILSDFGHSIAFTIEWFSKLLHQSIDPVPERAFHLLSGAVLIAVGLRLRRRAE
jgi:hypothetical protein